MFASQADPHPGAAWGNFTPDSRSSTSETKLITHAIGAAAFNTINALARDIRINTGYARANDEAHALARQALTHSGDIDPSDGVLTVRLDPMPTARANPRSVNSANTSPPRTPDTRAPTCPALRDQEPPLTVHEIWRHVM